MRDIDEELQRIYRGVMASDDRRLKGGEESCPNTR